MDYQLFYGPAGAVQGIQRGNGEEVLRFNGGSITEQSAQKICDWINDAKAEIEAKEAAA